MLLPKLIGYQKAAELLLLGESFSAETAKQLNMINDIVEASQLYEFALAKAVRLAQQPPQSLQATRQLMRPHKSRVQHQMHQELEQFSACLHGEEARTKLTKFIQKK